MHPEEKVKGPATGLILIGFLGIGFSLTFLIFATQIQSPFHEIENRIKESTLRAKNRLNPQEFKRMKSYADWHLGTAQFITKVQFPIAVFGFICSSLAVAGGFCMRSLVAYPLAVIGSVAIGIPGLSACCCLGFPFALWSIATLVQPAVRHAFDQGPSSNNYGGYSRRSDYPPRPPRSPKSLLPNYNRPRTRRPGGGARY